MIRKADKIIFVILIIIFILSQTASVAALQANAAVAHESVFLGEPFTFQIQVSGSESPEKPDLSEISGFAIAYKGGQQNSSTSVTIINGRMTRNVNQGYVFSYQLTPKHTGRLTIPSISVHAGGATAHTAPLHINVQKPEEMEDFKLRLELSKRHCYVSEPITLTVTWYLGGDVKGFNMNLPLLERNNSFHFIDPEVDINSGRKFYRIPLSGGEVVGEKGERRLGNKKYATITFRKILIPKKAGYLDIEPASIVCEALVGYRKRRSAFNDDFFSELFNNDLSGFNRRGVYRKVAVPSNSLKLRVSEVPDKGKPANFTGHVGEYKIKAEATPREMSVGDPITLKITLSGPDYLEHVNLPPLNQQKALSKYYKIPQERAVGETRGRTKVYTQTIRPLRPGLEEIPSIELPFFNTKTGKYGIAKTDPIPVKVESARIVTAMDAEGAAGPVSSVNEVETWTKGIAYNYEDMSVIKNQRFGPGSWLKSPAVLCMIVISPALYLLLFIGSIAIRRLYSDPLATRARKAYGKLKKQLREIGNAKSNQKYCDTILEAIREYLGSKLRTPGGALTFNDAEKSLAERGIDIDTLQDLKDLFEQCEQGRYAGNSSVSEPSALSELALDLANRLEKKLKW